MNLFLHLLEKKFLVTKLQHCKNLWYWVIPSHLINNIVDTMLQHSKILQYLVIPWHAKNNIAQSFNIVLGLSYNDIKTNAFEYLKCHSSYKVATLSFFPFWSQSCNFAHNCDMETNTPISRIIHFWYKVATLHYGNKRVHAKYCYISCYLFVLRLCLEHG